MFLYRRTQEATKYRVQYTPIKSYVFIRELKRTQRLNKSLLRQILSRLMIISKPINISINIRIKRVIDFYKHIILQNITLLFQDRIAS